jgi:uncharacterized protein (TIGR03083 family)
MAAPLDAETTWQLIDRQRAVVADLLADLTEAEWRQPSLCPGWTVRDVAGHLALQHRITLPRVVAALVRARGSVAVMGRDTAVRHAQGRTTTQLVEEVRSLAGHRRHVPVISPLEVLTDLLVHGRDIADPLGREVSWPTRAAVAVADRLWDTPRHLRAEFSTRRRLAGYRLVATDTDWAVGEGDEVTGRLSDLVMLMARRPSVLPRLGGPGAERLRAASAG